MKVTILQPKLYWKDTIANRSNLEEMLWQTDEPTDLILLPEAFNTGFSPESNELAEPMNGSTMQWMQQIAQQFKAAVCGSLFIKEDGKTFNKLIFSSPDGRVQSYSKRHLFGQEKLSASHGKEILQINHKGFTLGFGICYDLRFPAWCRKAAKGADLLLFVANWPASRIEHWKTLLKARAIENQCYVIGINITGGEIGTINYNGQSLAVAYDGTVIANLEETENCVTIDLNLDKLKEYRERFPFLKDADNFNIDN